jgi:hypothetical protein
MTFVNLTPHTINEAVTGKNFESSGIVARVKSEAKIIEEIDGIAIFQNSYGEVENIPAEKENTLYIVSGLVLEASDRTDLVAPGELVRDEQGKAVGCKGFRRK